MSVCVEKPSEEDKAKMKACPVWSCGITTFDWHYDSEEICLILEGEVTVEFDGGSASFGAGDLVIFQKGLSCVWKVKKPVKKHYMFR